jgi:glucokinase
MPRSCKRHDHDPVYVYVHHQEEVTPRDQRCGRASCDFRRHGERPESGARAERIGSGAALRRSSGIDSGSGLLQIGAAGLRARARARGLAGSGGGGRSALAGRASNFLIFDPPAVVNSILVGDVGGTHARFALVDTVGWRILQRQDLTESFPTFIEALHSYVERVPIRPLPSAAAIAVAGPVSGGTARFTNRGWDISEDGLKKFGFKQALLINDFAALAFSVEVLRGNDLHSIGPELKGLDGGTITILGPGTGFGVSCLARYADRTVPMATEGGHMGFAPGNEGEMAALHLMWKRFERVSVERILSGSGLETLYNTLQQLGGREALPLTAAEISAKATQAQPDLGCRAALTMFCSVLGTVAGDLALAHGARGGVYIAGGIAQKIEGFLAQSPFRARFEDKGRLSPFVAAIPTKLIVNPDVGLLGAARSAVMLAPSTSG